MLPKWRRPCHYSFSTLLHFKSFRWFSLLVIVLLSSFGCSVRGQLTTDPTEVAALNSIFSTWKISSNLSGVPWNTSVSGDPCTGTAIDDKTNLMEVERFNPGISCKCTLNALNSSTCHITKLKAAASGPLSIDGIIPEELQNLKKLQILQLSGNVLKGPIPAFLGNLTSLVYLNLSSNMLSGPIPMQLGNLQNLTKLDLSINSLNGSLPKELGNLVNLEDLRLESLGVSGDIPAEFTALKKLQTMWISDNNFTGRIPDFIGSLTELTELRMQGNSFQGPIPASFANLTKLTQLRIGELLHESSTLAFLRDMASLRILVLRNSLVSDRIPTYFGNYAKMEHLDLSFNNLTGPVPEYLLKLPLLGYLFLGNNSFSGQLPLTKSPNLLAIDLSYNELSGIFPPWVKEKSLKLNLVLNNFSFDSSNDSILPFGLRCLQKNFPCSDGSSTSFAVNCGSSSLPEVRSGEVLYEIENILDQPIASYYVANASNWGFSSVGRFFETSYTNYIQSIGSRFPNTQNSELFQDARLSPSSLRYYGIKLVNGMYNVKLSFGETDNWNPRKGKRLFDIFIQGKLVAKDYDITRQAQWQTLFAVEPIYSANVTNNFLEIHFFWAGKGTCCVPSPGSYGPSVAAISVTSNSLLSGAGSTGKASAKKTSLIAGITVAAVVICFLVLILVWRQKKRTAAELADYDLLDLPVRPNTYSYTELRTATEDFNVANKLGEGGFGMVFKGVLSDGMEIAVKQLTSSAQGTRQFAAEVATISSVQHRNLVKLHGCCYERNKRLLVYEYLPNRSLDLFIFGKNNVHLNWSSRFAICQGIARGLAYLHEESSVRIVHRDIKASNILLDNDLSPKIADFGLAKLYDENKTHVTTGVAGTAGYLAPEYAMRGQLTEKADVFAFGVLALEIICGKQNHEPCEGVEKAYLLEWAWHLHEEKRDLDMMDPTLSSYNRNEASILIGVAFMCTQSSPSRRPAMSRVVAMLVGDMEVTAVQTRPSYLMDWKYIKADNSLVELSRSSNPTAISGLGSPIKLSDSIDEGR